MDQKFPFVEIIGYGDSNLDDVFCSSIVFKLHAIIHDAAGAVCFYTGKEFDYSCNIGRTENNDS